MKEPDLHSKTRMDFPKTILSKQPSLRRLHTVKYNLYRVQKQTKLKQFIGITI